MKKYLQEAISEDNTSGAEYFLASIVQDAVIQECTNSAEHEQLRKLAQRATLLALHGVHDSMGLNSFIICETVRGVIHGLVALGGDPLEMAEIVITSLCVGSIRADYPTSEVTRGMKVGIKMAARDLGLSSDEFISIANRILLEQNALVATSLDET